MIYIVSYMCTIVGVYSCAVDANQCVRALRRVGCIGAIVVEARLNSETPTDPHGRDWRAEERR